MENLVIYPASTNLARQLSAASIISARLIYTLRLRARYKASRTPFQNRSSPISQCLVPERRQTSYLKFVSIEHIVGIERDQSLSIRMRDVDASLLD
jgi:hypothetical protein